MTTTTTMAMMQSTASMTTANAIRSTIAITQHQKMTA